MCAVLVTTGPGKDAFVGCRLPASTKLPWTLLLRRQHWNWDSSGGHQTPTCSGSSVDCTFPPALGSWELLNHHHNPIHLCWPFTVDCALSPAFGVLQLLLYFRHHASLVWSGGACSSQFYISWFIIVDLWKGLVDCGALNLPYEPKALWFHM